jgi:uncharacterized protein (DUF58 family)
MLPPRLRPSHLKRLLAELDGLAPGGDTDIAAPLHQLAETLSRRGMIVLISDLLDAPQKVLSALQHFRFAGHEVLVFHLLDEAEIGFSFEAMTEFTDLETGERLLVSASGMRAAYLDELRRFLAACEKGCAGVRADYALLNTSTPLDRALSEYLHRRSLLG